MKWYLRMAVAASVALAAPAAFAQSDLILPPYDGSGPTPTIATETQALAALHQRGVAQVQRLGKVGDYWESDGVLAGKPVVAYVFVNGAIELKPAAPGERVPVQSAELPQ